MPTKRIPKDLQGSVTAILKGVTLEEVLKSAPKSQSRKSKGGKSKKAKYETYIKNVPEKHLVAVEALIEAYFEDAKESSSGRRYGLNSRYCTSETEGHCSIFQIDKMGVTSSCLRTLTLEETETLYFLLDDAAKEKYPESEVRSQDAMKCYSRCQEASYLYY